MIKKMKTLWRMNKKRIIGKGEWTWLKERRNDLGKKNEKYRRKTWTLQRK